jgi:hypothetical protein
MPISIDINRLEKLDQIRHEVILADLVLRCVESLHEIDEGR